METTLGLAGGSGQYGSATPTSSGSVLKDNLVQWLSKDPTAGQRGTKGTVN